MQNVLEVIHYLHHRNIVHRDIKPENILLMYENNNTAIKVTDFGLAKSVADGLHTYCGTPQYYAPEVCFFNFNGRCVDSGASRKARTQNHLRKSRRYVESGRVAVRRAVGKPAVQRRIALPADHGRGNQLPKPCVEGNLRGGEGSDHQAGRCGPCEASHDRRGAAAPLDSKRFGSGRSDER